MVILTLGRSNKPMYEFMGTLLQERIDCLLDVRGTGVQDELSVRERNLRYLVNELNMRYIGPRSTDLSMSGITIRTENPFMRYRFDRTTIKERMDKLMSDLPKLGQGRVLRLAVLGREPEPFYCHRAAKIARLLTEEGFNVSHLLGPDTRISHGEYEKWLIARHFGYRFGRNAKGDSRNSILEESYRLHEAYILKNWGNRKGGDWPPPHRLEIL